MSGKRGVAPCGHSGEHLTANYVRCDAGCDTPGTDVPAVKACAACPKCGSADVEPFAELWMATGVPLQHCLPCGAVFPA